MMPVRPPKLFKSPSPGGALLRRLLPAVVVVPILFAVVRYQGEQFGLYETRTGVALMAAATVAGLVGLVWHFAVWLEHADVERRAAEAESTRSARYVELTCDMVCTADFSGYYQQLNSSWTKALG